MLDASLNVSYKRREDVNGFIIGGAVYSIILRALRCSMLIVCSLIVFVIFLKNMHLCICEGAELTPGLWICQTRTKILLDKRG